MKKREFIKILGTAVPGMIALSHGLWGCSPPGQKSGSKNWAWVHPGQTGDAVWSDEEWKVLLTNLKRWGVDSVLLLARTNVIVGQVLPIAKELEIELHAWIISLEWPDESDMKEHPSWYVVNGLGESCIDKPPYIPDYRWLCPSNPEVIEFMKKRVTELCAYEGIAGVHLDYIRYPDVVLARPHRIKYDIPQDDLIHPQFDYCYCEICREQFKKLTGNDPLHIQDPASNKEWEEFRWNSLTNLVNELYDTVHEKNKMLTAAVFPTPQNAKMRVRQDWLNWKLDAVMPMIYQRYEEKDVEWIGTATREGVEGLNGKFPLYSGLHLSQLSPEELGRAAELSLNAGAAGITLFTGNNMTGEYFKNLSDRI